MKSPLQPNAGNASKSQLLLQKALAAKKAQESKRTGAQEAQAAQACAPAEPLDRAAVPPAAQADAQVEPLGVAHRPSAFAALARRAPARGAAPAAERAAAVEGNREEGEATEDWPLEDPSAGERGGSLNSECPSGHAERPVVPGSKLSFADLARRGAMRKEALDREARAAAQQDDLPEDPPWDDAERPAGSRYSPQEWAAAREGDRYYVCEFHSANEAALLQFERPPQAPTIKVVVGGKVEERPDPAVKIDWDLYIDWATADLIDGCLLLGPAAKTDYPRAVRNKAVWKGTPNGDWPIRIIRPRVQDETRPWMRSATATFTVTRWDVPPEEAMGDAAGEADESSCQDRPRC